MLNSSMSKVSSAEYQDMTFLRAMPLLRVLEVAETRFASLEGIDNLVRLKQLCCCFPEDKSFRNLTLETGWMNLHDRNAYEKANLRNADKLHDLISTLDEINCENKVWDACFLYKDSIPDEKDLRLFYENPLAYEWEFRIWNSY